MSEKQNTPQYTLHYIPAKINYNGPTAEFTNNFEEDPELSKTNHITYFRGRKLVGQNINKQETLVPYIQQQNLEDDSKDECIKTKDLINIREIYNYEREGNDSRLNIELSKYNEFVDICNIIHS